MIAKSGKKLLITCIIGPIITGVVIYSWLYVLEQQAKAERSCAYGRLGQMRFALQEYEENHGSLPSLILRDGSGKPIQSWRSLILPYLRENVFDKFDLTQPWDSADNTRHFGDTNPGDWVWFSRCDPEKRMPLSTHVLAYLGPESIWDAKTSLPKGKTQDLPNAILLLSIPKSDCHPLKPFDLTEEEVRKRVSQGEDILFIMADAAGGYGRVSLEHGDLKFTLSNQEPE